MSDGQLNFQRPRLWEHGRRREPDYQPLREGVGSNLMFVAFLMFCKFPVRGFSVGGRGGWGGGGGVGMGRDVGRRRGKETKTGKRRRKVSLGARQSRGVVGSTLSCLWLTRVIPRCCRFTSSLALDEEQQLVSRIYGAVADLSNIDLVCPRIRSLQRIKKGKPKLK